MSKLVTLALALALASAAGPATSKEGRAERRARLDAIAATLEPSVAPAGQLIVEDRRPEEAKRNRLLSGFLFDCENGVWNLGDREVASDRLARLEAALLAALGEQVSGQRLVVRKYAISLNGRAHVEEETFSGTGGIAPELMKQHLGVPSPNAPPATLKAQCPREKTRAGWFDTSEISNNFSPLVVEMDLSLDGEDYAVRAVYSPEIESWDEFGPRKVTPVMAALVQRAIAKANEALVSEVKRRRASVSN